jgi:hypothetical protein
MINPNRALALVVGISLNITLHFMLISLAKHGNVLFLYTLYTFLFSLLIVTILALLILVLIVTRKIFGSMKISSTGNPHTEELEGFPRFLVCLIRGFFCSEEAIADLSALRCRLVSKKTGLWKKRAILLRASTSIVWGLTLSKIQNLLWFSRNRTRR